MSTARNEAETLNGKDGLWSSLLDQAGEVWLTLPDLPFEPEVPLSPVVPSPPLDNVEKLEGQLVAPSEVTCDDEDFSLDQVDSPESAAECSPQATVAVSDWDDDELEFIDESWLDLTEDESPPSPAPGPSIPIRGHRWKVGEVTQRLRLIAERAGGVTIHQLVWAVERLGGDEYSVARVAEELAERGIGVLERPKRLLHARWLDLSQASPWQDLAEQAFAHLPRIHPTWQEVAARLDHLAAQPLPAAIRRSLYEAYLAHHLSRQEEQALFARLERLRREHPDLAPHPGAILDEEPAAEEDEAEDEIAPLAPASDARRREDSRLVQWRNLPEVRQIYATLCVDQLWMVARTALMYRCATVDYEDLYQEGCVGLLRAIDLFDVRQGFRFQTYAQHWVRQHIHRAVAEGGLVRIPSHVSERYRYIKQAQANLEARLGREPTLAEVAAEVDIKPDMVVRLQSLEDYLPLEAVQDSSLAVYQEETDPLLRDEALVSEAFHAALRAFTGDERRRRILILRLHPAHALTLQEVGERMGITRERVRQIETRFVHFLQESPQEHARQFRELVGWSPQPKKRQRAVVPEPAPLLDPELAKQTARWRERRLKRERRLEARIVAFTGDPMGQEILRLRKLRRPPLSALAVRHRLRLPLAEVKRVEAEFERFLAEQPSTAEPAEPQFPAAPTITVQPREDTPQMERDRLFLEECIASYSESPVIQQVLQRRLLHTPAITQMEASRLSGLSLDNVQWLEKNFAGFAMKRMRQQEGGR